MNTPNRHHCLIKFLSPSRRIGLWLLSFSLFSTYQSISFAADNHSRSDAYWAEAAKLYPAFEPPEDIGSHPTADNDLYGLWGPILPWLHIPVSAATLPDGRILTWASNRRDAFPGNQPEFTYAATWDPATGNQVEINHNSHDMFCAHQVMLEDGRVFVNGGRNQEDSVWTSVFDYRTSNWTLLEDMNRGRWYNTSIATPDGKVFTAVGTGGGPNPEVWSPGSGWTLLTGISLSGPILDYTGHGEQNWWPLLNLAPNGQIFHSGPTPRMHYIDTDGNGTITQVGPANTDWYPKHGATVMYDEGKLLVAGGWTSGSNGSSTDEAMVIDFNGPTPIVTPISPMGFPRKFHNGIVLPDGEILIVGGNGGLKFSDAGTVLAAEIWNPDTEAWREVADASVPRNYHSIALLLPDATVLSAGGGLCGTCAANHQNAQVYSPPYLFNPNGSLATRPVISSGPPIIDNGDTFQVSADANMQQFSLIKMSSTTHAVNTDANYINVPFTETSSGQYDLTAHNNSSVLSPGFWMLFALNAQGVPSVAFILQVTTGTGGGGGLLLREWWTGIPGKNVPDLTNNVDYPNNPAGTSFLTQFEAPSNWADNYGNRLRGYIQPATTGDYTFWIASDDRSELWLSTDDLPANANLIASTPGWTNPKQWTKFAQQESITITLQASQKYYIEALHKDGGSLDHLAVAWQGPGLAQQVISGLGLTAFTGGNGNGTGEISREWWTGIPGKTISALTGDPNYPNNPNGTSLLNQFEAPSNWADNYGNRLRGYLHPPTTGDYTFWIASDDASELRLSTDELPASANLIASTPSWTNPKQWTKFAQQESIAITLQAGQKYYVEALHKDGGSLDHLAVAWQGPGVGQDVIDGSFLSPFSTGGGGNQPPILTSPGNQVTQEGNAVNLALVGTDPDSGPNPLSFIATGLPPGLTLDSVTGIISGTVPVGSSGNYTVTVTLTDGAGLDNKVFTWNVTLGSGTGAILREWWLDIRGNTIAELTSDPNYPDNPSGSDLLTQLEAPENIGTWYGTRIRGFLHPTVSGDYTFWIAGDDHSELWLSTDESAANAIRIANVPDFTLSRQWTKYPEQTSAIITLQAGQKYYIEVIHKERSGPDNVAVSWEGPGMTQEIIDGPFLSPFSVNVGETGEILREWWTGILGKTIDDLTNDPDYPNNPNGSDLLSLFETPQNWANNYGTRVRGYIHPTTTGNYTFWIASDDRSELWLSSDELPANATLISRVPAWTSSRQWTKYPEQESATINLQAGQKYYVEALHKEGGSLDNLAVAWQGPGLAQQVISGPFLSSFSGAPFVAAARPQIEATGKTVYLGVTPPPVDLGGILRQGLVEDAGEKPLVVEFSGAIEPEDYVYRILCSIDLDLFTWEDCTDQFILTERIVHSENVPPTVTLKWISKMEQSSQKFFRIELEPGNYKIFKTK